MRFVDLLSMSLSSLFKRKVRTILTVLGVVIGVASIVVMVSLGLGLKKETMENISQWASLTEIQVRQPWNNSETNDPKYLDQKLIDEIMQIPHVASVSPILEVSCIAKYGNYEGYLQLEGVTPEYFEHSTMTIGQGKFPDASDKELTLFYGNQVLSNFYNSKNGAGYWETGELPDIDLMNDSIMYILDTDAYWGGGQDENGGPAKKAKKHLFQTSGVLEGTMDDYSNYAWYVYCDLDQLMAALKKEFKGRVIPGQPTTKKGKPYKEIYYSNLIVTVDDMANVADVNQIISDMGYECSNDAEWIESEQKSMNMIQAVLGGIGAVSLLVAAIGITNTMMMSIYERTKEIGVMKVLGCDMRNIQRLFLYEAGFIGLIGGAIGLAFSYGLSALINQLTMREEMGGMKLSYIPVWLAAASVIFAILVGMISGFFPARRAMKLSPLAAIRNE